MQMILIQDIKERWNVHELWAEEQGGLLLPESHYLEYYKKHY